MGESAIPKMPYTKQTFSPWKVVMKIKSALESQQEIGYRDYTTIDIPSLIGCLEIKQPYQGVLEFKRAISNYSNKVDIY